MKVILMADIRGVGKKDEIINASDGYARNFLFPKKLAVEANKENLAKLQSKNDSKAYKRDIEIKDAKKIADKLNEIVLTIVVRAGENGKIFGGVTSKEIAEALKNDYLIDIDKKKIVLKDTIKNIGRFSVDVKLYEGIVAKLTVNVIS